MMKTFTCSTINSASGRARPGFTLVELVVAIGATVLLIAGISQVFSSVNQLVTSGTAVAELDQTSRAIEKQFRDDFEQIGALRSEEMFLAIRSRKLGDSNHNRIVDPRERVIYLTSDDREADLRDGITPYAAGSRAITRRLDEIIFVTSTAAGGGAASFQAPRDLARGPVRGLAARIYYGQGLRPAPDRNSEYFTEAVGSPNRPRVPIRRWLPDGDFGQRAGELNTSFNPTGSTELNIGQVTGRNEYAGSWLLLRQPLILAGGFEASGPSVGTPSAPAEPRPDTGFRYAPLLRDADSAERFAGPAGQALLEPELRSIPAESVNPLFPGDGASWAPDADMNPEADAIPPYPRLIRQGRVDLCAQSLESVRSWLEGQASPGSGWVPGGGTSLTVPDATPLDSGRWNGRWNDVNFDGIPDLDIGNGSVDAPLWQRAPRPNDLTDPAGLPSSVDGVALRADTLLHLQSALAGCFTRVLAESEPPLIDRLAREDAGMDLHAVLGTRCSSFEIAWSDGTTWPDRSQPMRKDIDGDGTADIEYRFGDIIWFDAEFTLAECRARLNLLGFGQALAPLFPSDSTNAQTPDPEIIPVSGSFSEVDNRTPGPRKMNDRPAFQRLIYPPADFGLGTGGTRGWYDPVGTRAAPDQPAMPAALYNNPEIAPEYLAIWGFRVPVVEPDLSTTGVGTDLVATYGTAWSKPSLIRIRMTLHDSQFRIPGGRRYEFVLRVDPQTR